MSLVDVASVDDVKDGASITVRLGEIEVCLVNSAGTFFALHNTCTHAMERMAGGWVDEGRIECPRHGAMFCLSTGEALTPPATTPLPTFAVQVRDGRVLIDPTPSHPHPLLERNEYGAARG